MITEINAELQQLPATVQLYGVLLFTEAHPHVIKTLKDTEYFNALHTITGDRFALFTAMAFPGHWGMPESQPGMMSMMRMIWREPHANRELLATFGLDDTSKLPQLVVFAFEGDNMVKASTRIEASSSEQFYSALVGMLEPLCSSEQVTFEKDKKSLQWHTVRTTARKVVGTLGAFRGAAGI